MPIKFSTAKYIPIDPAKPKPSLSPNDKFFRLKKQIEARGKEFKFKKYHFHVIEKGNEIFLFDGEGQMHFSTDNSMKGYINARLTALEMFLRASNQNGGFTFDYPRNLEHLTEEELEKIRASNKRQMEYKKFTNED